MLGLKSPREITTKMLSKLEQDLGRNLQSMSEECQRLVNLKQHTARIEGPGTETEV